MQLQKISIVLLALLLAAMAMVPCVNASGQNTSNSRIIQKNCEPELFFDDFLQPQEKISEKTSFAQISSSIKKYAIIQIDAKSLKKQLRSGQKIPIHLKGIAYKMDLKEDTYYPSSETGVYTFSGHLETSPEGKSMASSEIHLTLDDEGVIGKISLDKNHCWYIDELDSGSEKQSGNTFQYVYNSDNVEKKMSPMGEDRYALLSSGESKPLTALSDAELRQYVNESQKGMNARLSAITGEFEWYDVNILVVCDNQMYNAYSNWVKRAQSVVSDANSAMSYDDIKIRLVPTYDASQRSVLSNNFNAATPLQVFYQYVNNSYLNSKNADIAMYLSGNQFSTCIGASWGFHGGSTSGRHAVMMYERAVGGGYGANPQERANVFTHEVGHLFDADHETAPGQTELYNRATTYSISGTTYHTLMNSYVTTDPTYFSSDDPRNGINYGDADHDNSRRLRETKATVAGYI